MWWRLDDEDDGAQPPSARKAHVELSSFIAAGKLTCKIDKVRGVIEANQEDKRNALYKQIIQEGDLLLNRLQKLSKVTDM